LNILMLSDVYFPRINGVSTSIKTFTHSLRKAGHRVILAVPEYGEAKLVFHDKAEDIYRVPARRLILDKEDRLLKGKYFAELLQLLQHEEIDILHIHTPFRAHYWGLRLARELGCPCVATYHTFFEEYLHHYVPLVPRSWLRAMARRFTVSQSRQVDKLIVPSTAMHELLQDYGVANSMTVIPTGLDLTQIAVADGGCFRDAYAIDPQRPVMGHVGRIAHEKNITFLLQVLKTVKQQIPNILLLIAGEGPAKKDLIREANKEGLSENVLFVGYLSREQDLWDCYRAADVFVFSSRTETQGLVLLEAMATGVPVVSTAVLGTKDILLPQRGALVAAETVADFAQKVVHLLDNPALRENKGREGAAYVHEWSDKEMALRVEQFYLQTIQQRSAAKNTPETILAEGVQ